MAVRIFVSYSHKDAEFRRKLDVHLAALKREGIRVFYDGDIEPGAALDLAIKRELRAADVFVALASPEYLHSAYCFEKEYGYALRRAKRKTMRVVVAVIKPCQWKHTRMARYKALPEDGKEVVKWGSRDSAFEDIVNGVRRVVKLAQSEREAAKPKPSRARPSRTATVRPAKRKRNSPSSAVGATQVTSKPAATTKPATAKKLKRTRVKTAKPRKPIRGKPKSP